MSKFYLYLEGRGEGCDYTIACNERLVELQADSFEKALEEVLAPGGELGPDEYEPDGWSEINCDVGSDYYVQLATILQVEESRQVPLFELRAEQAARNTQEAEQRVENEEREEFERLKKKFAEPK